MSWILALGWAQAAELELHAYGALGDAPVRSAGLGVAIAQPLKPRLSVEGLVQGGFDAADGPILDARPELRWTPIGHDQPVHASLIAGYGLHLGGPAMPAGVLGVGLDLPHGLRLQGRYQLLGAEVHSLQLSFGWVRRAEPDAPEPEPIPVVVEPEPPVEEPPFELSVSPEGSQVWLPHPVCRWLDVEAARPLIEQLPPGTALLFRAPGHLPQGSTSQSPVVVDLEPAPAQGSLLVIAQPGDLVTVGEDRVQPDRDGVVVLNVAEGVTRVQVVGGGRSSVFEAVSVVEGQAGWLRASEPGPLHVTFPVNSARLGPQGRQAITDIALHAGDWSFSVSGSFSPEGDLEDNRALAEARAGAAAAALIEAGVPADRVVQLPAPEAVDEQEDWAQLRGAWVRPIPPASEGAP